MANDTDSVTITDGGPLVVHRAHHDHFDVGAFFAGIFATLVVMWLIRRRAARLVRDAVAPPPPERARFDEDYAALARRTATLERIVTEPATRLTQEIDTLR